MGKKKINIQRLLLHLLIAFLTMHSYSQAIFTKELKWELNDSITTLVFQDTNQIIEWGESISPSANIKLEKLFIKDSEVLIIIVDKCFGVYCPSIYVFLVKNKHWRLRTSSAARLKEQLEIKVDNKLEKIIFRTKSGPLGELPFEIILE